LDNPVPDNPPLSAPAEPSVQQRLQLLRQSWLAELPEAELEQLARASTILRLSTGQQVHARGDLAKGYMGVISGRLGVSTLTDDGKVLTLAYFLPGDWFGEISLVDGLPRTHDTSAMEDSELLLIAATDFQSLLQRYPQLWPTLAKHLCQRLRLLMDAVEEATLLPMPARLARKLLQLHRIDTRHSMSQQALAEMMGVSRQSVARVLAQWVSAGWISTHYNRIDILDSQALEAVAGHAGVPR
jgi:CRP-like cAMP-binding protein